MAKACTPRHPPSDVTYVAASVCGNTGGNIYIDTNYVNQISMVGDTLGVQYSACSM